MSYCYHIWLCVIDKLILFQLSNGVDECDRAVQNEENNATKTKHVLTELLYTERQYTAELGSILRVCSEVTYLFVFLYIKLIFFRDTKIKWKFQI